MSPILDTTNNRSEFTAKNMPGRVVWEHFFANNSEKLTKIQCCGPNGRNSTFLEFSRKIVKMLSKNGPVTGFWVQYAAFCINVQGSNRILSRIRSGSYPVPKDLFSLFFWTKIGRLGPCTGCHVWTRAQHASDYHQNRNLIGACDISKICENLPYRLLLYITVLFPIFKRTIFCIVM